MSEAIFPQMPRYSQEMSFDLDAFPGTYVLMIRYYSAWNSDGSREPVSTESLYWPEVFRTDSNGNVTKLEPIASFGDENLKLFSSHASVLYYLANDYIQSLNGMVKLSVIGFFEQTGYMSLSLRRYLEEVVITEEPEHFRGDELSVVDGGLNPFIEGNPSVFAYERPTPSFQQNTDLNKAVKLKETLKCSNVNKSEKYQSLGVDSIGTGVDEHIDFYRPTTESFYNGEYGDQESIASDGCSADYLGALRLLESTKPYFILKIKVPTTFIHDDNPETTYAGYQVQEFTIDTYDDISHSSGYTRYGLSSRQVNDYRDANGYAYVFLAPVDVVTQLALEQGLDYNATKIPPVYTWNGNTGYVLDRGIVVIRHRRSDPTWEGYVGNTTCYLTDAEMQPVQPSDLGEYYPELTGVDTIGINVKI